MLTAIRELADAAERERRIWPEVVAAGDASVLRTREMLPVLREAGRRRRRRGRAGRDRARDRGGAVPARSCPRLRRRTRRRPASRRSTRSSRPTATAPSSWSKGSDLDADTLERELEQLGDSLLVVGDRTALKVHVHTDDPGAALSLGVAQGTIDGIEIANMHQQTAQREARLLQAVADAARVPRGCVRARRGRGGCREPAPVREPRGGGRRRRHDDEPVDRRSRGGDRGRRGGRGAGAAEQRERDHGRRGRPSPTPSHPARVVPTRTLQAGLAARGRVRSGAQRRGERRGDGGRDRGRGDRCRHDRVAGRPAERRRGAEGNLARPRRR